MRDVINQYSAQDPFSSDESLSKNREEAPAEDSYKRIISSKKQAFEAHTYLFPIDETEEFHDPFSDLNLFLAKRIKREILREKNPKKWSRNIQTLVLKEILPDFRKKFPKYRLGHSALKQTWDKVFHYLQMVQNKKGALKPNGRLNIDFLIRENLKSHMQGESTSEFHPYNTAHRLAIKISECIAAIDGERPILEDLTKTIWAVQKHLITNKQKTSCPFEKYDDLDKLIVRFQLEEIAKAPLINREQLEAKIKRKILNLKQLERIRSIEELGSSLSAHLAERLYQTLNLHKILSQEERSRIEAFVRKEVKKESSSIPLSQRERAQIVQRILFLYKLAMNLSQEEARQNLEAAVQYVYHLSINTPPPEGPVIRQEVYQFIEAELSLFKEKRRENPLQEVLNTLLETFSAAEHLPLIPSSSLQELEIFAWKVMQEEHHLTTNVPSYLQETIYEELTSIHIDHPAETFTKIIQMTLHYLKKVREIDISSLDGKLRLWSMQNDMISRCLYFDETNRLLKRIQKLWQQTPSPKNLSSFVKEVYQEEIKEFPQFAAIESTLRCRIAILFKYFWYNSLSQEGESAFSRFLKWHLHELRAHQQEPQFGEVLLTNLEELCEKLIPLTPFNRETARDLLTDF